MKSSFFLVSLLNFVFTFRKDFYEGMMIEVKRNLKSFKSGKTTNSTNDKKSSSSIAESQSRSGGKKKKYY